MNIITLTDSAKHHIQKMLEKKGKNAVFRLSLKKTGCSGYRYMPEIVFEKKESDIEVREEHFLIYIDRDVAALIQGTVIDYAQKSLGTAKLEFLNLHAKNLCGCGESFQIE